MSKAMKALTDWGRTQLPITEQRIEAFEEDFRVHPHSTLQFTGQAVHVAVARKKLLNGISTLVTTGGLSFEDVHEWLMQRLVDAAMDAANASGNSARDMLDKADLAALGWAAHVVRGMSGLDDGDLS